MNRLPSKVFGARETITMEMIVRRLLGSIPLDLGLGVWNKERFQDLSN
jgi:hypothetical protein